MHTIIRDIKDSGRKKLLLFIPLAAAILIYISIQFSGNVTQDLLLREKFVAIHNMVDAIEASVNVESSADVETLLVHSLSSVAYIDAQPYVYAAAFTLLDGELVLLSERDNATDFNPLDYDAFIQATQDNAVGELTIGFTPSGMEYRDLLMYYKWMPTELPYLIVIGVSRYSVTTQIPAVLSMNLWIMLFVTLAAMLWSFYIGIRQIMRTDKVKTAYLASLHLKDGD